MDFKIDDAKILVTVDKNMYSEDILHKCFYWYTENFNVHIDTLLDKHQIILEYNSTKHYNITFQELIDKIKKDLIDFKLRKIINIETQNIRDLLIAKAFSNGEFEEDPPGTISDPVGFVPLDKE